MFWRRFLSYSAGTSACRYGRHHDTGRPDAFLCVVDLPRAKGLFIALIWRTGATGEERFTRPLRQDETTHNRPEK